MDLKKIELIAVVTALLLATGSLAYGDPRFTIAVCLGSLFASINFRLLVWSWGALVMQYKKEGASTSNLLPRFFLKYGFLLAGVFVFLGGFKAHPLGFGLGLSNIFAAILLSPLFPSKSSSSNLRTPNQTSE